MPRQLFFHISLELESLRLDFFHWTWASKAWDVNLLKCFKNMLTNKIDVKIMLNGKFSHNGLGKVTSNLFQAKLCKIRLKPIRGMLTNFRCPVITSGYWWAKK